MRKLVVAVATVLLLTAVAGCATRIGPGYVGIKVDLAGSQRGVEDMPIRTGWVAYNPASSQVVEYPTFVQTIVWTHNPNEGSPNNEEITFTTKDDMAVSIDVSLSYKLDPAKVPMFYTTFRSDDLNTFTTGFLHNMARDVFNETAGEYTVEQIMGDNGPFIEEVRRKLQAQIAPYGVEIDQFGLIGAPRPPQSVIDSINAKVQAQQIALQKEMEVKQAEADAQKVVARAQGQAQANELLTKSITPQLIQWQQLSVTDRWINRWNGKMPDVNAGQLPGMLLNINPKQ
jgi:regulator of protease activity HflC (stomatin/prohibitin superfamily)